MTTASMPCVAFWWRTAPVAARPQRSELTLELSYGLSLMPGVMLQPGAQLILHPGADPATPSALALGVNAVIRF